MSLETLNFQEIPLSIAIIRDPRQAVVLRDHYTVIEEKLNDIMPTGKDFGQVDIYDREGVKNAIISLFTDLGNGPNIGVQLHLGVYRPFAETRESFKKTITIDDKNYEGMRMLPEFEPDAKEIAEWMQSLGSTEFIQTYRRRVAEGIRVIPFPTVGIKYGSLERNTTLFLELEQAKRKIVCDLLPSISDDEARLALGQNYSAYTIGKTPGEEWII